MIVYKKNLNHVDLILTVFCFFCFIVKTFATLSPIPGFMRWLISKLALQSKLAEADTLERSCSSKETAGSAFREDVLTTEEESQVLDKLG